MMLLSLSWMLTQLVLQIRGQDWHEFQGHCYLVLEAKENFTSRKAACLAYGTYMVEIEEDPELDYVQTLAEGSGDMFWVGLEFNNATRKFYWDRDGNEPQDSMWLNNEPYFSGRCVALATADQSGSESRESYLLEDVPCTASNRVICEKNADMLETMMYSPVIIHAGYHCPVHTNMVRSDVLCAHNCSKNKFCTGFQYTVATQACTWYRFDVNCQTRRTWPLNLYVRNFPRC